jgi:hypothetical protein
LGGRCGQSHGSSEARGRLRGDQTRAAPSQNHYDQQLAVHGVPSTRQPPFRLFEAPHPEALPKTAHGTVIRFVVPIVGRSTFGTAQSSFAAEALVLVRVIASNDLSVTTRFFVRFGSILKIVATGTKREL